jgi:uncharacterized protein (DUF488 family)
VRAFPVSRRHPQFSRETLEASLSGAGIRYEWHGKALGGYRNVLYPEHMKSAPFRAAAAALAAREGQRVVHLLAPGASREHARDPQEELWRDD